VQIKYVKHPTVNSFGCQPDSPTTHLKSSATIPASSLPFGLTGTSPFSFSGMTMAHPDARGRPSTTTIGPEMFPTIFKRLLEVITSRCSGKTAYLRAYGLMSGPLQGDIPQSTYACETLVTVNTGCSLGWPFPLPVPLMGWFG
jgi:hypothetical protein